jgi:hypothetical protein
MLEHEILVRTYINNYLRGKKGFCYFSICNYSHWGSTRAWKASVRDACRRFYHSRKGEALSTNSTQGPTNMYAFQHLYSSDLLYVVSLSLAKVSVFQFLEKLCVEKRHKSICRWSTLLVVAWTVPVFFTLAFKCGISSPWDMDNAHCIKVVSSDFSANFYYKPHKLCVLMRDHHSV